MKEPDLVFVDIETTGLVPQKHEIIEIATLRVGQKWVEGQKPEFVEIEEWCVKVRPLRISDSDPQALKINGYTPDQWASAVSLSEALQIFSEKADGAIMVAHNVAFDAGFLDHHMSLLGISNKMHYHRLDTVSMAYAVLHSAEGVSRYSLGELCKYFGITNEKQHSAMGDTRADFELFKKLMVIS